MEKYKIQIVDAWMDTDGRGGRIVNNEFPFTSKGLRAAIKDKSELSRFCAKFSGLPSHRALSRLINDRGDAIAHWEGTEFDPLEPDADGNIRFESIQRDLQSCIENAQKYGHRTLKLFPENNHD